MLSVIYLSIEWLMETGLCILFFDANIPSPLPFTSGNDDE